MNRFFYGDTVLEVPKSVYLPREDSLLLAGILEKEKPQKVLDMGSGSGFLAIISAKKGSSVTAADLNPEAIEATQKNAAINFVSVETVQSDLFDNIEDRFDLIVFNSPYLPFEEPLDMQWTGGMPLIEKFLINAKDHLTETGKILLLISTLTGEKEFLDFMEGKYSCRERARQKIPWEELVVYEIRL